MKNRYLLSDLQSPIFKFILSLIFLLAFIGAQASHMVGSDITYQCTSTPGVYLVTAKVYRDCQGIQWCGNCPNSLTPCSLTINIAGAEAPCNNTPFGSQSLAVVPNQSGFDIMQLCYGYTSVCSNCGSRTPGSFSPGIEVYTFSGIIDLRTLPSSCCKVVFSFRDCCRNAAITTLSLPQYQWMYVGAMVDRCTANCNSAPAFTNDPVAVTCAGQDFTYNLGAIDPDGDSLSYAFGEGMQDQNTPVNYQAPYNAAVPFPYLGMPAQSPPALPPLGIYIDPYSGDIRFRPMGTFVSNLVIEVTQWRLINGAYQKVGVTRRDLQFYSVNCPPNNPPKIFTRDYSTGAFTNPNPKQHWTVCANQQLCFIVTAWDDPGDTTQLTWNAPQNLVSKGATFTPMYDPGIRRLQGPRLDSFKFCWTPPPEMAGTLPHYFTTIARDINCTYPVPSRSYLTFDITVKRVPVAAINKVNRNCGFYDFTYTLGPQTGSINKP